LGTGPLLGRIQLSQEASHLRHVDTFGPFGFEKPVNPVSSGLVFSHWAKQYGDDFRSRTVPCLSVLSGRTEAPNLRKRSDRRNVGSPHAGIGDSYPARAYGLAVSPGPKEVARFMYRRTST